MRRILLTTLATPLLIAGCKAPCQSLCDELAAYAEDCGFSVSEADLDTCYQENARQVTSAESQDACRDYTDDLRTEWTCEDLAIYFDGSAGGSR